MPPTILTVLLAVYVSFASLYFLFLADFICFRGPINRLWHLRTRIMFKFAHIRT